MARYYLDSCIWVDHLEDRKGSGGRLLGSYATRLFMKIIADKDVLVYSHRTVDELRKRFGEESVNDLILITSKMCCVEWVGFSKEQYLEAKKLAESKRVPVNDALHAILARDSGSVLVSQDKHFQKLVEIVKFKRPEDII
ncbi:type II toxin-antitoxin system VapC family toxin [Nanoarchaeota archaeon]